MMMTNVELLIKSSRGAGEDVRKINQLYLRSYPDDVVFHNFYCIKSLLHLIKCCGKIIDGGLPVISQLHSDAFINHIPKGIHECHIQLKVRRNQEFQLIQVL